MLSSKISYAIFKIQVDPDQLKTFISNFNQSGQDNFKTSGCNLGGTKYMYLSSNEKVARFKKGTSGVHTIKTTQGNQFIIIFITARFYQNMYLNDNHGFHNFRFHFSLHHLLVRGANNARTGCDSYRKVRRLFDSSRLLNQARSFLSRKCIFKFSRRLSLFAYNTSCTSL